MERTIEDKKMSNTYCTVIPVALFVIILFLFNSVLKSEFIYELHTNSFGYTSYVKKDPFTIILLTPIIFFLTLLIIPSSILIIVDSSKNVKNNKSKKSKWFISLTIINGIILFLTLAVTALDIALLVN